jgi:UDP-N-acetylglucosamine 4,6-dehydratase
MSLWHDASVLITGGTGSFGKAFVGRLLDDGEVRRVVLYSRDELKQYEVRQLFDNDDRLRFMIGDVREKERLARAMSGVDYVVHAAALKQVDTAEYNPFEAVKTNVLGSQNVIDTAIDVGVKRVVALSTDKASSPINLYGATKLCADKLFIAGNHYAGAADTRFCVVRYGNVVGSRGSVVPFFKRLAAEGADRIPITDERMTRFWITLPQAVQFVLDAFDRMSGGELYVPRIPSMRVMDLARVLAPGLDIDIIGIRPGEKLHEEMISVEDAHRTLRFPDHYLVTPVVAEWGAEPAKGGEPVSEGFMYRSDLNDQWLSEQELTDMAASS